jgi:hypothetical protein
VYTVVDSLRVTTGTGSGAGAGVLSRVTTESVTTGSLLTGIRVVERVRFVLVLVCASAVVAISAPSATIARTRVRISRVRIHASDTSARQVSHGGEWVGTARLDRLDVAPHSTNIVEDPTFPATGMPETHLVTRITR